MSKQRKGNSFFEHLPWEINNSHILGKVFCSIIAGSERNTPSREYFLAAYFSHHVLNEIKTEKTFDIEFLFFSYAMSESKTKNDKWCCTKNYQTTKNPNYFPYKTFLDLWWKFPFPTPTEKKSIDSKELNCQRSRVFILMRHEKKNLPGVMNYVSCTHFLYANQCVQH